MPSSITYNNQRHWSMLFSAKTPTRSCRHSMSQEIEELLKELEASVGPTLR